MNSRRTRALSRLSVCLLLGLMTVSMGAAWKDEPRALSLTSAATSMGAIDAPGHHFGFSQSSVLAQTTGQLTLLALPSPVITGGQPCTTVTGSTCTITGGVNGGWTKTGPSPTAPSPNIFTFNTTTPNGATIPQSGPSIFVPTIAGTEQHGCNAPTGVGTNVTCTGTTATDIVPSNGFVVRFEGSAGPIDVMRDSVVGYTTGGTCPGRPTVNVTSQPDGHGRLAVTVATNPGSGVANNQLYALAFNWPTASTNAVVDIGAVLGGGGTFTANLVPAQQSVTFYARPMHAGQAVTVGFTAIDACGYWPSLAGGGAQTLALSDAAPSADVIAATANPAVLLAKENASVTTGAPASVAVSAPVPASVAAPVSNVPAAVSGPPVVNVPAAVSVPPGVNVPAAVSAPPAVSVPPAMTVPNVSVPAPAVSAPGVTPAFNGQPRVFPPFAQPQPLLPFGPPAGYPMIAPPAPSMPAPAVEAPAPAGNPALSPFSTAPESPPAVAPSAPAVPDSITSPAAPVTDSITFPVAPVTDSTLAPPAEAPASTVDSLEPDAAALPTGAESGDAIEPPFAQ